MKTRKEVRFCDRWWAVSHYRRFGTGEREHWKPRLYSWHPHDSAGRMIVRREWVGERRFDFRGACSGGWSKVGPVWGLGVKFPRRAAPNEGASDTAP